MNDRLLLVELLRGGSARLKHLLGEVAGDLQEAKGTRYADSLAEMGKPVLGLVCDPRAWYLGQWRLGCEGKGEMHQRLTSELRWGVLRERLGHRKPPAGAPAARQIPEGWGAARAREVWYRSADDVEGFREWLHAVLRERVLRKLVDPAWGSSPLAKLTGPMGFQFFLHFVRGAENLDKTVDSLDALRQLAHTQSLPAQFIRQEALAKDLPAALQALGLTLTEAQREVIESWPDRQAEQARDIARFYNKRALRMVARAEQWFNARFAYGTELPLKPTPKTAERSGKRDNADKVPKADRAAKVAKVAKADKPPKVAKAPGADQAAQPSPSASPAETPAAVKTPRKPRAPKPAS